MIWRRRDYRRPPVWQSRVADAILWFGLLSIGLGLAAFLADCQNRYF